MLVIARNAGERVGFFMFGSIAIGELVVTHFSRLAFNLPRDVTVLREELWTPAQQASIEGLRASQAEQEREATKRAA